MKTIQDVFTAFKQDLSGIYDANETSSIALLVLEEILQLSRAQIKAYPEKELSGGQSAEIENNLTRLQTGEPVQYIIGHTEFYGLPFKVNAAVLIPRPETEELVEWCLSSIEKNESVSILDIGTGSGAIAISLKRNLPQAKVSTVDISIEAVNTAKENAKLNKIEVEFIHDDILNPTNHSLLTNHYSLIISNPPYVTPADKELMHKNVTDFEPHTALFVPQDDPLLFYRAIADFAVGHLVSGGLLFFEINESYGQETVDLLAEKGFTDIELRKDMNGRDRMVRGVWMG